MTRTPGSLAAAGVALVGAFLFLGGSPRIAHAQTRAAFSYSTPSEQYLTYRRSYPPTPGLTPNVAAEDPVKYRGHTMELEGRLSGVVRADADGALLILDADRYGSLTLAMDLLPEWVQPGSRLRVLVVVTGSAEGEVVVGMPDMQVVAVASANDINAAEYRARQNSAAQAERSRRQQEAMRAASTRFAASAANRSRLASRGSGSSTRNTGYVTVGSRGSAASLVSAMSPGARDVFPYYRSFIKKWNRRLSDGDADDIAASVLLYSEKLDVDPRLVCALIIAESDFRPQETSHKGAMGLGQLMPDEVKDLGLTNPYDPVQNVAGAIYLLRGRLNKYSGGASSQDLQMRHIILALASYNAGMGAVKKYGGVPPYRETRNYVKKIQKIYTQLCGGAAPAG